MKIDSNYINPINDVKTDKAPSVESSDFEKILEKAKETGDTDQLRKACNDLESVFINMMMKTMRSSSIEEEDSLFKKSESEKMFEGMLDEEYASKMSKAGGIGIADMLFDQMSKYLYNDEEAKKQVSSFEMKG